jgi:hypothetical protein
VQGQQLVDSASGAALQLHGLNIYLDYVHYDDMALMRQLLPSANLVRLVGIFWHDAERLADCTCCTDDITQVRHPAPPSYAECRGVTQSAAECLSGCLSGCLSRDSMSVAARMACAAGLFCTELPRETADGCAGDHEPGHLGGRGGQSALRCR